ncbi:MAG: glycosyltransferase family 39 protein [Candidatus Schekmanbacteria bacterium]|nr:glycosyltransferase family 39 protein [Candidatus Schekmanbacteria bacterium]
MVKPDRQIKAQGTKSLTGFLIPAGILILSLILRLTGISYGLPQRLHPDEWSQIQPALSMFSGDYNPHIFYYPSFTVYFYFLSFKLASFIMPAVFKFSASDSSFWMLGRIISAIFGSANVIALYLLAQKIYDRKTAIVSALILAIYPLHVQSSHYAIVDIPLMLWITAALFFMCKAFDEENSRALLLAGIFCGLASSTKYTALPLMLILIVSYFVLEAGKEKKEFTERNAVRTLSVLCIIAGVFLLLFSLPLVKPYLQGFFESVLSSDRKIEEGDLGFFIFGKLRSGVMVSGLILLSVPLLLMFLPSLRKYLSVNPFSSELIYPLLLSIVIFFIVSPYILFDFTAFLQDIKFSTKVTTLGYYENKIWSEGRGSSPLAAFLRMLGSSGKLLSFMSLAGIFLSLKKRALPIFLWAGIYLLMISSWTLTMPRFILPLVPCFILFAACAITRGGEFVSSVSGKRIKEWVTVSALIIILCFKPVQMTIGIEKQFLEKSTLTEAFLWAEKNIPEKSRLIVIGDAPDMSLSDKKFNIAITTNSEADYLIAGFYKLNKEDILKQANLPINLLPIKSFSAKEDEVSGPEIYIYQLGSKVTSSR